MSGQVATIDGTPLTSSSEAAIEGFAAGSSQPAQVARQSPFSWDPKSPTATMRVGWILKRAGKNIANFAFSINPQSIARTDSSRTQLWGTRGAFYVDDFGAGPTTIQITQLISSGRPISGGYQTLREHILQFNDEIWEQAVGPGYSNTPVQVYFYDNHLYNGTREAAAIPERVYFPPNGFTLTRSTSAHNVWQAQITMITLAKPSSAVALPGAKKKTKVIIVQVGQTLHKIAVKVAGHKATAKQVLAAEKKILELNPRVKKTRKEPIFSPANPATKIGEVEIKAHHVRSGEKLTIPA